MEETLLFQEQSQDNICEHIGAVAYCALCTAGTRRRWQCLVNLVTHLVHTSKFDIHENIKQQTPSLDFFIYLCQHATPSLLSIIGICCLSSAISSSSEHQLHTRP